jgi:hypothetical protein
VKKILLSVIAVFIGAAFYMISNAKHTPGPDQRCFGDAEAIGSEEDGDARNNYELMRLADPATGKIPANIRQKELAYAATLPSDRFLSAARTTTTDAWQPRGPWNVGGRTRAFGIDVTNEKNLVAGSTSGSMWRSTDGGLTWVTTTPSNQYKGATCLAQDTRAGHTNVWYCGTGEETGASASEFGAPYYGNGIYKSTDGGITWDTLHTTKSIHLTTQDVWGDYVWNVVTDPHDLTHDVVYAAVTGGIYRSQDGGATWTAVLGGFSVSGSNSTYADVAISPTGVVYATLSDNGPAAGIFRSTDGITFTNITPSNFPTSYNRIKIGISPSDERQVYFLGNTPNFGLDYTNYVGTKEWNSLWRYTYISGDGSDTGGMWRDRSLNLPATGTVFDKFTCQGSYDLVVKVKPNDTNIVFIGGTNLYRSTTGFADTTHTTYMGGYQHGATLPVVNIYVNHHPDQHELVFLRSDPNKMISANDGGIFYCNDNTVASAPLWTSLNNGYLTSMFYTCAIDHATDDDILIGGAQDNGSWFTNSANLTKPWVTPRGGDGSFCAIADNSQAYYFSSQLGKMAKVKLDNAGKVDSFARIDPKGARGYLFINPFVLDPNNNNIMYLAGGKFLWRNNDLSGIPYAGNYDSINTNWFRFPDSNLAPSGSNSQFISALAVAKTPANRLYIGTSNRKIYRLDSANTATHIYHDITPSTFPTFGGTWFSYISCIAVDPNNGDHVMVVFSNYGLYSLFYSADAGVTWKKVAGNLETNKTTGTGEGPSCRWASIIPVSGGTVYLVGTSVGLFATTALNDTNTVWVQQGANSIGSDVVDMIDYRSTDGLVVVATHSGGMYSSHITSVGNITGVKEVNAVTQEYHFENYPNPFSNETTIKFDLPESSNVSLNVYDQAGRLVRTLANESMREGSHKYSFAANGLPSGIYYCNLRAGKYSETRKLQLIR